jgi:hypothetical protein
MGCMGDLSTVRGQLPELQRKDIDVLLLNINTSPGNEMLSRFEFEFTPLYLIFQGNGEEVFRSNSLPSVNDVIQLAES